MANTIRRALTWMRGRWHADVTFQHACQERAQRDHLERLSARFDSMRAWFHSQQATLAGVEARLGEHESRQSAMIAETARNTLAEMVSLTGSVGDRLGQQVSGLDAALTAMSQALSGQQQSLHQALQAISQLRQSFDDEQLRRQAWEAECRQSLEAELAAATDRQREIDEQHALEREAAAVRQIELEQRLRQRESRRPALTEEDLTAIEGQGLFIVGSARSGTTILSDCLNLSPEIYMLQEAFFFCNELAAADAGPENYDFAAAFNAQHVAFGNPRDKGTYVPTGETPYRTPLEFLNRFRGHYRYLGEKIAFGPRPHAMGDNWEDDFFAYQARYFYQSRYLITIRSPHEALWSMHKLFPDFSIPAMFECWLRSLRVSLELYLAFPHTHMTLLEWFDASTIRRISEILQVDIPLPSGWIGRSHQKSALDEGELAPVLRPYHSWCEECGEIYAQVRANVGRDTLRFGVNCHPREYVKPLRQQISQLLDEVLSHVEREAQAA